MLEYFVAIIFFIAAMTWVTNKHIEESTAAIVKAIKERDE